MQIVYGTPAELRPNVMSGMARYRHRVFVEKLGWQLKCESDLEFDEFDRPDTLYVVASNECGDVVGTARLLPTTGPYLLGEVFPQLLDGLPVPSSPEVWELSRFAAMDLGGAADSPLRQFSSAIVFELLRAAMTCAASKGAQRLITVSPLGIERLLRRMGFQSCRAGSPMRTDGAAIFACWIPIPAEIVARAAALDKKKASRGSLKGFFGSPAGWGGSHTDEARQH